MVFMATQPCWVAPHSRAPGDPNAGGFSWVEAVRLSLHLRRDGFVFYGMPGRDLRGSSLRNAQACCRRQHSVVGTALPSPCRSIDCGVSPVAAVSMTKHNHILAL